MGATADTTDTGEPHWYSVIEQEQSQLRITPHDIRGAMEDYDGAADLWQTYTLDGMNLSPVLDEAISSDEYVLEIGCNRGKTTATLEGVTEEATVVGIDLYRDGSFQEEGPSYVQAAASYLPFREDSLDTLVAPASLGAILKMGVIHRVSREKRRENERMEALHDTVAPEERSAVRRAWADACVSTYVEQVLDEAARATADGGNLLLADGQLYLLAEHREGAWRAIKGRGYVKDWEGGGETVRNAEDYYGAWLEEMDASEYVEDTQVRYVSG